MEYKFTPNDNYEDFAAGRVIYHMGGEPTFPVRLSLEIYERCLWYSDKKTDITLYDCCCGGAYMLTILGLLKGNSISRIYGSDIDTRSLQLAADNLGLITRAGIRKRREELEELYRLYGKLSHQEAIHSTQRWDTLIGKEPVVNTFWRNAFEAGSLSFVPDIVITDVPYGNMVDWKEGSGGVDELLEALVQICGSNTILCVSMDKKQRVGTTSFQRLERQIIGKRRFELYKKKC